MNTKINGCNLILISTGTCYKNGLQLIVAYVGALRKKMLANKLCPRRRHINS